MEIVAPEEVKLFVAPLKVAPFSCTLDADAVTEPGKVAPSEKVVTVPVAVSIPPLNVPAVRVIFPAVIVNEPITERDWATRATVILADDRVKSTTEMLAPRVTVPVPELLLKITLSSAVGTPAPPDPPEEVAQ